MQNFLNLKYIIIVCILVVLNFFSCRKIATDMTATRTNALTEKFKKVLTGSTLGWIVCVKRSNGEPPYNFYMKFTENGRVEMKTDWHGAESNTFKESSYGVKLLQQPTLSFDTYNYINEFADPGLGNPPGETQNGDFQYAFTAELVEILQNTQDVKDIQRFTLKGVRYQSDITFIRSNNEEDSKVLDKILAIEKLIDALKHKKNSTLTVLKFDDETMEYHYFFKSFRKLFAFTELETAKKGAPMGYYFDLCSGKGLQMRFNAANRDNLGRTPVGKRVDRALVNKFAGMSFFDFTLNNDSTIITFKCVSEGEKTAKQGTLTTKNILAGDLPSTKLANMEDSNIFLTNRRLLMTSVEEFGKLWNFEDGETGEELRYQNLLYRGAGFDITSEGAGVAVMVLWFLRLNINNNAVVGTPWVRLHTSLKISTGDKYYVCLFRRLFPWKYMNREFGKYTSPDSTKYIKATMIQQIEDKIFYRQPSGTEGSAPPLANPPSYNAFILYTPTVGYQLHNVDKNLVLIFE